MRCRSMHICRGFLGYSRKYISAENQKAIYNGFWLIVSQSIFLVSALLLSSAFARLFPPYEYGKYQYVISTLSIVGIFSLHGINTALVRAIAIGLEGSLKIALLEKIKWSIFGAILLFAIAAYYFFANTPDLGFIFLLSSGFFLIYSNFSVYQAFLNGKEQFRKRTFYFLVSQLFYAGGMIGALIYGANLIVVFLAYFVTQTIPGILFYVRTAKTISNANVDRGMVRFGKHLSFIGIVGLLAENIDRILVFHFLGPVQLAMYSFAILIPEKLRGIFKDALLLTLPIFSKKPIKEIRRSIFYGLLVFILAITFIVLVYVALAPAIFQLLFPQYIEAVPFTRIAILNVFGSAASILGSLMVAKQKVREIYMGNIVVPLFQIITIVILGYYFQLWGIIWARILTQWIGLGLGIVLTQRIFNKMSKNLTYPNTYNG